jgi:hypothetical protein
MRRECVPERMTGDTLGDAGAPRSLGQRALNDTHVKTMPSSTALVGDDDSRSGKMYCHRQSCAAPGYFRSSARVAPAMIHHVPPNPADVRFLRARTEMPRANCAAHLLQQSKPARGLWRAIEMLAWNQWETRTSDHRCTR